MQAAIRFLCPFGLIAVLTACGGGAAPASSPPASSPAASKPAAAPSAAASAAASAKPAASAPAAASGAASASAKPAASGAVAAASGALAASGSAAAKPAASGAASAAASTAAGAALTPPALPAAATVTLDAKTTAVGALDFANNICQPNPACVAVLPAAASFLKKARDAKAMVFYSLAPIPNSSVLPQVAPQADEPSVSTVANKFFNTNLDSLLKGKGIKTVVLMGVSANGAVLYTSYAANDLGYAVVVNVDGIAAGSPFYATLAQYQILAQPGHSNPNNEPGAVDANTKLPTAALSKSDLITFK